MTFSRRADRRTGGGRIPVLYVGGLGRSGSTLLERSVAQLPGVCGLGETVYMWERGLVNDERCGCGQPFSACGFWTAVGDAAFGGWENVDAERLATLARTVDDVKHVPRMFLGRGGRQFAEAAEEYVSFYERLYAGVRDVTGCEVIVDSSKITSLAYLLNRSQRVDLRMVHILRDPRAVAYAWTKVVRRPEITGSTAYMPRYSPAYMGCLYSGHHVLLEALRLRGVPTMNLRYEDFADEPLPAVRAVAEFAGLTWDRDAVFGADDHTLDLGTVHTASGNPSRFQTGEVAVRRDESWRRAMPRRQQLVVSALTAPLALAYGYRLRPPAPVPEPTPTGPSALAELDVWPSVTVVVPTHDRPEMMRRAVRSVVEQDYPGRIDVVVVFDKADPDTSLVSDAADRPVSVVRNSRTPGLAGARNTGILGSRSELVAFLDDDDHWVADKLSRQVRALAAEPTAQFATTAMAIEYEDSTIVRLAGKTRVTHPDLVRSRLAMLHSSSFVARRDALVGPIGLIDETIPRSMAEDWDILLRAARQHPIVHLDEPLVRVRWGPTSYFADQWQTRNEARLWMLEHHPELLEDRVGAGLTYGKLAFGSAMLGRRRDALGWSRRAVRANWREPRTVLALLVVARLAKGQWIVDQLNRRGRGI
ncbi:glycosyltransferase [Mumia qirimensis]|uniref:glycosyltransferase n=1 Tax=Mumia qirimensis TaxID=3234852 RepID=UPI00351CFAA4